MTKGKKAASTENKLRCPTCRGPVAPRVDNPDFPFCSKRCKAVDLAKWFTGAYAVPGKPLSDDGEESTAPHIPDDQKQ